MAEEQSNALPATETPASPSGGQPADTVQATSGADSSEQVQEREAPKAEPSSPKKAGGQKEPELTREDFRRFQASQNRLVEQERQRRLQLEAQIREQQLKGMNDYEKAQFAAQEAEKRAQELEQALKQKELEDLRRQDMMRLNEKTGIPLDMLDKATSYDEAQEMAMSYLSEQLESTVEERVNAALEAKLANRTDVGGGKPAPVKTQQQEMMEAALEQKSATSFVKSLFIEE
jgi:hypothetical protein